MDNERAPSRTQNLVSPSFDRAHDAEPLLTLKDVAEKLGLPIFKVTRAAKAGLFPTYTLYNRRKLARLSEVVAAIEQTRTGGQL